MARGKRQSQLTNSSDVLQSLFQGGKSQLSHQFIRWKLWRFWPDVVGSVIAEATCPVDYVRGGLILWVDSSARMQEMNFVKNAIRDKVNSYLGQKWVHYIKFTLDRKSVPSVKESEKRVKEFLARAVPEDDPSAD